MKVRVHRQLTQVLDYAGQEVGGRRGTFTDYLDEMIVVLRGVPEVIPRAIVVDPSPLEAAVAHTRAHDAPAETAGIIGPLTYDDDLPCSA